MMGASGLWSNEIGFQTSTNHLMLKKCITNKYSSYKMYQSLYTTSKEFFSIR